VDDDGHDNIPAPLVFVWDAAGETLDVVPGCLAGLTMVDGAALEDATARAVTRISEANPPTKSR
jgi:hypothetical protein